MLIALFLAFVVFLVHLILNWRPGKPFNERDIKAFKRVKEVRDDLDDAKNWVAPSPPKPDFNLTAGFSLPKQKPEAAPKAESPAPAAVAERK